jgi:hypothetical protein
VATGAINLRGSSSNDPHRDYIRWVNDSGQKLGNLLRAEDLDRLVFTRRYWLLQSMAHQAALAQVQMLLQAEIAQRARELEETVASLQGQLDRWSRSGFFAVADTSFYIHAPEKLQDLDVAQFLTVWEDPIHLLIPILVIDELDRLKESRDKHVRWRAAHTLAVLDDRLTEPNSWAVLRREDFSAIDNRTGGIPRGAVTIEVLFDPPGHTRLPIDDDELVDRAATAKWFSGRDLRFLTFDTGQAMRARAVGLAVVKLKHPAETESAPG